MLVDFKVNVFKYDCVIHTHIHEINLLMNLPISHVYRIPMRSSARIEFNDLSLSQYY